MDDNFCSVLNKFMTRKMVISKIILFMWKTINIDKLSVYLILVYLLWN